ncbi:uncharacterized protein LOC113311665 [Papaver somniferum]|uniref:uncharacterized protein LOC113311665 n=1 Tax=Papaver somniferum TaxID=3469 RepID=UPI000E6F6521|nr:uncharacterized protein LOC113311665 [Papaver somniferum]
MRSKAHIPEDRDYEQEDSTSDGDISTITDAHLCKMIEKVMSKRRSIEEKIDRLHRIAGVPFKLNIREFRPEMNFQVPKLPEFDEKTDDPYQHVLHYQTAMTLWQYSDELMCKMFPQSLTGGAAYQYDQRGVYGSLVKRPANTLEELYDRAEEYARVEDDFKARETRDVNRSSNHPNEGKKDKSKNRASGHHNDRGEVREKNQGERLETGYQKYHDMKIEVQRMINAGKIQEYVKKDFGKVPGQFGITHVINAHVINVSHARIHSMTRRASEDETRTKLRQLKEWYLTNHIDFVSGNGAEIRELGCTKIEFSEADMICVYTPHNDVIVITAWIGMFRVHRILVDTGSSVSVLFSGAYSSMNLPHDLIEEDENPIGGFSGEVTKKIGKVKIPIIVADKSVLGNFLLLDCRSPYNAIVGRDWLHEIGAVTSSYHQCLKFIAPEGVVKVRSDHMAAHKCHESAMDEYKKSEVIGNQIMRVEQK